MGYRNQTQALHKEFRQPLNVVIIVKTHWLAQREMPSMVIRPVMASSATAVLWNWRRVVAVKNGCQHYQ